MRNELWSIGLRNSRSIVVDQSSGDLLITEQGQEVWEELNVQNVASNGGENYGWSCKEGSAKVAYQSCDDMEIAEASFSYDHYEGCGIVGVRYIEEMYFLSGKECILPALFAADIFG